MICPNCGGESGARESVCGVCGERQAGRALETERLAPPPLVGSRGLPPFVNRAEERHLLQSRFEQACDGEGQVVLLAGEPGIGKSRLARALREGIAETPHTWLETSAAAEFIDTPFYAWTKLLRQLLGWDRDDAAPARGEALAADLATPESLPNSRV